MGLKDDLAKAKAWEAGNGGGSTSGGKKPTTNKGRVKAREKARKTAQKPATTQKSMIRLASRLAALKQDRSLPFGSAEASDVGKALDKAVAGYKQRDLKTALDDAGVEDEDVRKTLLERAKAVNTTSWAETGLDYIGRPGEAVKGALVEGGGNPFSGDTWEGAWEGFSGKKKFSPTQALARGGGAITGVGVSKKEAREFEEGLPGEVRFATNLAGGIALDPLSYLSFGTTSAAKGIVNSIAPRLAQARGIDDVAAVAGALSSKGARALSKTEKALVLEEFGPKALKLLKGAPGGVKVAGRSIPGTGPALKKAGEKIGDVFPGTTAERVVRAPRTGLRQLERAGKGKNLAGQVEQLGAKTIGAAAGKEQLIAKAMNNLAKQVPKAEDRTAIIRVLEGEIPFEQLPPNLQGPAQVLRDRTTKILGEEQRVGLLRQTEDLDLPQEAEGVALGPEGLNEPLAADRYYPRIRTDLGPAPKVGSGKNPLSASVPQRFGREEDIRHASTVDLAEEIPFDLNPFRAVGKRAMQSEREVARLDYLSGLGKIDLDDGMPLLREVGDEPLEAGWKPVTVPVSKTDEAGNIVGVGQRKMAVREEVAAEVQKAMKTLSNESDFGKFASFLDKYMGLWKGYATVPLPFGLGFVIRNATGNVFNSAVLAGTNLRYFKVAKGFQKRVAKGLKEGDPLRYLDDAQARLYQEAVDNNALGSGFFRNDIGDFDPDMALDPATLGQKINPLSDQNVAVSWGRAMNDWIEQNARLGTFLSQRAKGLSPEEAAGITRKYLFDYGDLTEFDQWAKRFSPFWTFTRKNLPLQLEHFVKQPGKYAALEHFMDAARNESAEHHEEFVPEYIRKAGGTVLPFEVGDEPVAYIPDLPPFAASEALAPLESLPGMLKGEPGQDKRFARDLFNTLGIGGPAGVAKALGEVATGRQIFSGREFQPGEQVPLPFYLKPLQPILGDEIPYSQQYLLEQMAPGASKIRGVAPTAEKDQDQQVRRLLSLVTGQQFQPIGDATARSEMYRRYDELGLTQKKLENEGIVLPEGSYASTTKTKKPKAKSGPSPTEIARIEAKLR